MPRGCWLHKRETCARLALLHIVNLNMKCWPIDMRNATRTTEASEMNRQGLGIGNDDGSCPTLSTTFVPGVIRYAVQTKISYDINREVSPCLISTNYKEPIAVLEVVK